MLGGKRISKSCLEMDAIGEVDELNALLGVLVEEIDDNTEGTEVKRKLINIQHKLFTIGSQLAALQTTLVKTPKITKANVKTLEKWIDKMESDLPKLKNFIIPGGSEESSLSFYARAICRRAERRIIELSEQYKVPDPMKQYINRLSDLLFVLGRWMNLKSEVDEVVWKK